jgi:ubiquinone/menaquinone biosynthesis C-methylase UbiE
MSIYRDKNFAEYWDERAGEVGEVYKRFVLDPLLFSELGSFREKTVLELGCGNGYLAKKFLAEDAKKLILVDISEHNLEHASQKVDSPKVEFLLQDATKTWQVNDRSIDVIYSNMMLNEVENIQSVCAEAFRVLRPGGVFAFSTTHPAWDLFIYAQQQAGVEPQKVKGLGGYFRRGYAKFIMNTDDYSSGHTKKRDEDFEVEHYQRPVSDYFAAVKQAGFSIEKFIEPELTAEILEAAPRFQGYADRPISMVLICSKP